MEYSVGTGSLGDVLRDGPASPPPWLADARHIAPGAGSADNPASKMPLMKRAAMSVASLIMLSQARACLPGALGDTDLGRKSALTQMWTLWPACSSPGC